MLGRIGDRAGNLALGLVGRVGRRGEILGGGVGSAGFGRFGGHDDAFA